MVNMLSRVRLEYPGIYTTKGKLKSREPKKYICDCGNGFSSLKSTFVTSGMKFGSPICKECGKKAKDNIEFNIWKRMVNDQIEQEDCIINIVMEHGCIQKETLDSLIKERFANKTNALGTLVYFGYLLVDKEKRDGTGVVEYSVNNKKDLSNRNELIR